MQKRQPGENIRAEEVRHGASDVGRVGREVLKPGSVSETLRNLPWLKRVVVYLHCLELRHAGEEVGGDGGEAVVAGHEDAEAA